jgi:hypothetical protein
VLRAKAKAEVLVEMTAFQRELKTQMSKASKRELARGVKHQREMDVLARKHRVEMERRDVDMAAAQSRIQVLEINEGRLQPKFEAAERGRVGAEDKVVVVIAEAEAVVVKARAARTKARYERKVALQKLGRKEKQVVNLQDHAGAKIEAIEADLEVALDTIDDLQTKSMGGIVKTRTKEHGRPYSYDFEEHARFLLAGGASASVVRHQMHRNAKFMLTPEALEHFTVPEIAWFTKHRETVGLHSLCYAMVRIAAADSVIAYGYDETNISKV